MSIAAKFPPLYECSLCGAAVKVTPVAGADPLKEFSCGHDGAIIWANRKATLRGVGALDTMPAPRRAAIRLTLSVRQALSALTGRSI